MINLARFERIVLVLEPKRKREKLVYSTIVEKSYKYTFRGTRFDSISNSAESLNNPRRGGEGGMRGAKMTTEKSSRSSFANKAGAPSLIALRHAGCSLIV